jgi:hypothetical protein
MPAQRMSMNIYMFSDRIGHSGACIRLWDGRWCPGEVKIDGDDGVVTVLASQRKNKIVFCSI